MGLLKTGHEMELPVENNRSDNSDQSLVLDIYPLSCYYFGSKQALPFKDETLADRLVRMRSNYAAHGMRTCVQAVILVAALSLDLLSRTLSLSLSEALLPYVVDSILSMPQVELFKHPHLLLLQVRHSVFTLPGGRLRPDESEIGCLRRKLSRKLSITQGCTEREWELGECLGMWWRPDFESLMYPYLSPNVTKPKECTKLFLVKLPATLRFDVPKNFKLLAVPLGQIHENHKTYGPIISGVAHLLSKFSFNIIDS